MGRFSESQSGVGVKRKPAEKVAEIPPPEENIVRPIWGPKPCFHDQYVTQPDTARPKHWQVEVFNSADPKELKLLNKLLSRQAPESAPSIVVKNKDKVFSESKGGWIIYVEYYTLEYLQIGVKMKAR